jgi:hypothetical protein
LVLLEFLFMVELVEEELIVFFEVELVVIDEVE